MKKTFKDYKYNVEKKLMVRQVIFFAIITALLSISVINVLKEKIDTELAISGFLLSLVVGLMLSRMFKIFWNEEKEKVVSRLDMMGTILLIVYIAAEIGRKFVFQYWLSGAELNAFGLVILIGLLLGRFLGTGFQIKKILTVNRPTK